MKQNTHPQYFPQAKVTCACGTSRTIGSTLEEIHVEVCSHCHPFYTGKQKLVDTARRVEKFQARKAKVIEPKAKKERARKPRVEPLKPVGKLFSTKSKIKSATVKTDDKKKDTKAKDSK